MQKSKRHAGGEGIKEIRILNLIDPVVLYRIDVLPSLELLSACDVLGIEILVIPHVYDIRIELDQSLLGDHRMLHLLGVLIGHSHDIYSTCQIDQVIHAALDPGCAIDISPHPEYFWSILLCNPICGTGGLFLVAQHCLFYLLSPFFIS